MDEHHTAHAITPAMRAKRIARIIWLSIVYFFDVLADAIIERAAIMRVEVDLFLGTSLAVLGILSFQTGKYCDGNTADYLSCTRPATYYYYSPVSIIAVVIGISLVLVWVVRRKR